MADPLILLDAVSIVRDGSPILEAVNLSLDVGERLALVGENGSGKTTLLRALVGLQPIAAGELRLFGAARRSEADFRPARQRIGFLLQDSEDQLFCPTVLEDVAFGPLNLGFTLNQATERAAAMLADLGLEHLSDRLTSRLSGGEKRLVALAGVLAMDPDVLLLDEPTNALDVRHLERLSDILAGLDVAMIVVSHDALFLARHTERAVMIDNRALVPALAHRHRHQHDHVHFHPVGEDGD